MENSNKIIQSLWVGPELSNVEKLCIKSFLANGHEFHLYVYEDVKGVPEGTVVKDANNILHESKIFRYQEGWGKGSVAAFSNLFRYKLLFEKGGWWVDMDVICLKKIDVQSEFVVSSSYEMPWGENMPNACILKVPASHTFLSKALEIFAQKDLSKVKFGELGPHIVQKVIREEQYHESVAPYYYFNPISWKHVPTYIAFKNLSSKERLKEAVRPLLKPSSMKGRRIEEGSYAVHLWNEVWRQNGLNKNDQFNADCLFERLKTKYNVS